MRTAPLIALAFVACSTVAIAANPFDAFKGKMKEGLYEYKMEMDMGKVPGMPEGMAMGKMSPPPFQKCITPQDIERGEMGRGRDGKPPGDCEIKDFNMSGNTATYTMTCTKPSEMTADNKITFRSDGFSMDMKMSMNQRGQMMNMTQHMESRYLGPCK
jgi:hypothetical protein